MTILNTLIPVNFITDNNKYWKRGEMASLAVYRGNKMHVGGSQNLIL